jgi:PspA associated protein B
MGIRDSLDALLGKTRLPRADLDSLFAITTASVTMQSDLNLKPSSAAGLCFKPIESSQYDAARTEIEELLQLSCKESETVYRIETDEYRFTWVILEDPDFEDLIAGIHLVSQTLIDRGVGAYLLCVIFRFGNGTPVYWVYNFKQGRYYPFIPSGEKKRDSAREFRMRALLAKELPIENDVGKWYPLWGIPL